ncbi:branched-chain amino acid ABC transporter permease [Actinoplanes sp. NEAU-A12]|uniref:Branched-chain amino acid ABC transporter permease n=1 Tax=Actinoplanes sandaracinus TaxID=3045177 RepID=A0ABT6WM84_9ACTN|nr:branched-chain amino acid ABC transporter permease [Actinoplanes sandaracinus]MDI6100810.1 branched-chain amino acid ABC transporter permease [Actinoplanes sandaracinus]
MPGVAGTALLLAAAVIPAVAGPYPVAVAAHALVLVLLAMSTQLLVAVAGLPAFGQTAYFGVGAYTAALLCRGGHNDAPLLLAAAALTAGVAAAVTAPMLMRTRGTAFLMATFAVQSLTATAAARWTTVTAGDEGLHTPPVLPWPGGAPLTAPAYLYWYALAVVALAGAGLAFFLRSRLALTLRGIAGHEPRMTALGHRVTRDLTAGYTIAGVVAGLAGGLLIVVNQYVSPADIGFEAASLTLLAAAIGAGTLAGAAIGAALVVAVRDGAGVGTDGLSPLLLGLLFLTVAYLRPLTARLNRRRG